MKEFRRRVPRMPRIVYYGAALAALPIAAGLSGCGSKGEAKPSSDPAPATPAATLTVGAPTEASTVVVNKSVVTPVATPKLTEPERANPALSEVIPPQPEQIPLHDSANANFKVGDLEIGVVGWQTVADEYGDINTGKLVNSKTVVVNMVARNDGNSLIDIGRTSKFQDIVSGSHPLLVNSSGELATSGSQIFNYSQLGGRLKSTFWVDTQSRIEPIAYGPGNYYDPIPKLLRPGVGITFAVNFPLLDGSDVGALQVQDGATGTTKTIKAGDVDSNFDRFGNALGIHSPSERWDMNWNIKDGATVKATLYPVRFESNHYDQKRQRLEQRVVFNVKDGGSFNMDSTQPDVLLEVGLTGAELFVLTNDGRVVTTAIDTEHFGGVSINPGQTIELPFVVSTTPPGGADEMSKPFYDPKITQSDIRAMALCVGPQVYVWDASTLASQ